MSRWYYVFACCLAFGRPARADSLQVGALFEWQRRPTSASWTAMLLVELPLERLARPRIPLPARRGAGRGLSEDAHAEPPPKAPRVVPPRAELSKPAIRRLMAAALRVQGDAQARARLGGLSSRARASAALPELMLRAARSTNEALRLSPSGTAVYDYTQTGGSGLLFEARATWRLDRLVFADEELRVERLRLSRERADERIVQLFLKHLFSWQTAQARLAGEELAPEERAALEIDVLKAELALDLLTDGAFSEERARRDADTSHPETPRSDSVGALTPSEASRCSQRPSLCRA